MNKKKVNKNNPQNITAADILALSIPERIQLVEDIWVTIAANLDAVKLSEEEKKIIDERLEAYYKNPNLGNPWEEVYKKLTTSTE